MTTRSLLTCFALLVALTTAPAKAADLPVSVKAPAPVAAPAYNWSGFYIGGHVGGAWGDKDWTFINSNVAIIAPDSFGSHNVSGLIAGGQIGLNWQPWGSNWVFGVEAQGSWSNADGEHTPGGLGFRTEVETLITITGRVGYAFDRVLVYAKGGYAYARDKYELFDPSGVDPTFFSEHNRSGWTVGGGAEVAVWQNWSAKLEYNFMDFGKKQVDFSDIFGNFFSFDAEQKIHVVKFGINYRFGGASGPVAARY
jgi:outer membrane immunogenic protein